MLLGLFVLVKSKKYAFLWYLLCKTYPRPEVNAIAMPETNGEIDQLSKKVYLLCVKFNLLFVTRPSLTLWLLL